MVGHDTMRTVYALQRFHLRVRQQSGLGPQHLRDETNIKAEWADAGAANSWPTAALRRAIPTA
jgi:hypothetical protein